MQSDTPNKSVFDGPVENIKSISTFGSKSKCNIYHKDSKYNIEILYKNELLSSKNNKVVLDTLKKLNKMDCINLDFRTQQKLINTGDFDVIMFMLSNKCFSYKFLKGVEYRKDAYYISEIMKHNTSIRKISSILSNTEDINKIILYVRRINEYHEEINNIKIKLMEFIDNH